MAHSTARLPPSNRASASSYICIHVSTASRQPGFGETCVIVNPVAACNGLAASDQPGVRKLITVKPTGLVNFNRLAASQTSANVQRCKARCRIHRHGHLRPTGRRRVDTCALAAMQKRFCFIFLGWTIGQPRKLIRGIFLRWVSLYGGKQSRAARDADWPRLCGA